MSIPLDRLYHYIESVGRTIHSDVVIYRFSPHGSKKIENLTLLHDRGPLDEYCNPHIICHDQEQLDFDFYQNYVGLDQLSQLQVKHNCYVPQNLRKTTVFDKSILIHSEKKSTNVDKYKDNDFIPVYYWSHAIISLDWFRYAQHLTQRKNCNKTFLIYNRSWIGTREYRLKFVDFLYDYDLIDVCKTTFNSVDPGSQDHYQNHDFRNKIWKPVNKLESKLNFSQAPSNSSADFTFSDYEQTEIEVVLETLFDDSRIHLTEKILRPIACAQPFILAAPAGSLKYLQEYGFKTYSSIWDESYDQVHNAHERLETICKLMTEISKWDNNTKQEKLQQAQIIADYNKKHFFSSEFFNLINSELHDNLKIGIEKLLSTNTGQRWIANRKRLAKYPEIKKFLVDRQGANGKHSRSRLELIKILSLAKKYSLKL